MEQHVKLPWLEVRQKNEAMRSISVAHLDSTAELDLAQA
jgi:hypothetical protein